MREIFDDLLEEGYAYEIDEVFLSEESMVLTLDVSLNFLIPYESIREIEERIIGELNFLSAVTFNFLYRSIVQEEGEAIKLFLPYLVNKIAKVEPMVDGTVNPDIYILERDGLKFGVLGETTAASLNDRVARLFEKEMNDKIAISKKVSFYNDDARKTDVIESVKKSGETEKQAVSKSNVGVLMGKAIEAKATSISNAKDEGRIVVIEGEIFKVETRDIRRGKNTNTLVTFMINDKTGAHCCKIFAQNGKTRRLIAGLVKGHMVKVKGKVEWDRYLNNNVVIVSDVEAMEKTERCDNAEEKRVELHLHTTMSTLDGFNDVKNIVKRAISWNHEAIAITDHGCVQAFPEAAFAAGDKIKVIYGMEGYVFDDEDCMNDDGTIDHKKKPTNHIILLAKNEVGLRNLYEIVSTSHIKYFYRWPRIPKSILEEKREGLIIGSACEAGEVFRAIVADKPWEELVEIAKFYDYLEVQPIGNNMFMVHKDMVDSVDDLIGFNEKIIQLGRAAEKPVVATSDAHYGSKDEAIYRNIIVSVKGFEGEGNSDSLYFRTTEEMLDEFPYLDKDLAYEIVVENPRKIADMVERIKPVPTGKFPPKIDDADIILRDTCMERTKEIYGDPIPEKILERLETELDSVINNGYAVMYVSSKMLVDKSMEDGYLVGSRGSVGSSFAATMSGITEVNPLPPHYICGSCKYLEWGDEAKYDCGIDMEEKICKNCGEVLNRDGFSIPFETFLGFEGDKEPDIDLNFAGEYQGKAHKFVDEIFGAENVYKAGTIGTVAEKTAYGFVRKYYEAKGLPADKYEIDRLTARCAGVKRTTGQHPGGIIIVPRGRDIHEFCPVQHPANDSRSGIVTTHFDYNSIKDNLLKLDILGHFVPSMIKHLQDMTGLDPLEVSLRDEKVGQIFLGTESLNIVDKDYKFTHGSFGIPEFGTKFVRQMLDDTKPETFGDLVRISGFSHGTDVWLNNARDFIKDGQATMREAIATRDDIMNYLIIRGLPNKDAFDIMERVRKGKGLTDEQEKLMKVKKIPSWYIESCKRISYMFPRAHAVAYVMMSYRIAYYKVYYPLEFYAVFFTTKIADFPWDVIKNGSRAVMDMMDRINDMGKNATKKEQDLVIVLELVYEMYSRGFEFAPPRLKKGGITRFGVEDGRVSVPLCALDGVGETVGRAMEEELDKGDFQTVEELTTRCKVNSSALESMKGAGALDGMPETDQFSFL